MGHWHRLPIKILLSAFSNCTPQLLPPLSPTPLLCSTSPLYSNFHCIFHIAISSNLFSLLPRLSSHFLLGSSWFCACSCWHSSLVLCLLSQPLPLSAPAIHFHTMVMFSGVRTHQASEIKYGVHCFVKIKFTIRREKLHTLL